MVAFGTGVQTSRAPPIIDRAEVFSLEVERKFCRDESGVKITRGRLSVIIRNIPDRYVSFCPGDQRIIRRNQQRQIGRERPLGKIKTSKSPSGNLPPIVFILHLNGKISPCGYAICELRL